MSTSYYYLRAPITSVRVDRAPGSPHTQISVWVEHALAGVLTVMVDNAWAVVRMFAAMDENPPITTFWGGVDRGCLVQEDVRGLDPDLILISDVGEVYTVKDIRAFAGRGKVLTQRVEPSG